MPRNLRKNGIYGMPITLGTGKNTTGPRSFAKMGLGRLVKGKYVSNFKIVSMDDA